MNRRGFLTGLAALVAAPAIVKADALMPVRSFDFRDRTLVEFYGNVHARDILVTNASGLTRYVKAAEGRFAVGPFETRYFDVLSGTDTTERESFVRLDYGSVQMNELRSWHKPPEIGLDWCICDAQIAA